MGRRVHYPELDESGPVRQLHELVGASISTFDEPEATIDGYEILIAGRPEAEQPDASPDLHTGIFPWASAPKEPLDMLRDRPHLGLHNLHYNPQATAELAMALLLAAAKCNVPFDRALRQGDWCRRQDPTPALLLACRRTVVLGFGEIGGGVGRMWRALGMHVVGARRTPVSEGAGG